jgi:hypothetical protein
MYGLKSDILAIFQKSADWLDWPCPVSAALQNGSQDFFLFSLLIYFFKYETIVRSIAWSFGNSDPDPNSVKRASSGLVKKIDMPQQLQKMYEAMAQGMT